MGGVRVAGAAVLGTVVMMGKMGCDLLEPREPHVAHWEPALSPDGRALVYESSTVSGLAFPRLDLATSVERQLTFDNVLDWSPHWSPDGTRIVFTSRCEENVDLYILVMDPLETHRLTTHEADGINPYWGSDGLFYFNSSKFGIREIYTIDSVSRVSRQKASRGSSP